jgi:predicted Zn-dependent protease
MKRIAVVVLWLIFCFSLFMFADDKQDLWLKAAAEKDPQLRFQYFEEFLQKYGEDEGKHSKYLYFNLSQTAFQLKQYDKSIQYGEKALDYPDLEANYKLQVYLILANAFNVTKSDLDKAYHYAGLVIDFGKSVKMTTETTDRSEKLSENIDKYFIAPAYRIQTHILFERAKDIPGKLVEATNKAVEAYKFHKTGRNLELILSLAYRLAKFNQLDQAITVVEQLCQNEDANEKCYGMLATWYNKKGKKDKAILYFEKEYQIQTKDDKAAKTALNIGVLLSKTDKRKAIDYFAEAFLLLNSDKTSNAYKYMQQLWFNELAKGKQQEEQDQGLANIIAAAKARLGGEM